MNLARAPIRRRRRGKATPVGAWKSFAIVIIRRAYLLDSAAGTTHCVGDGPREQPGPKTWLLLGVRPGRQCSRRSGERAERGFATRREVGCGEARAEASRLPAL